MSGIGVQRGVRRGSEDPRVQPGAYITDGSRLLEVLEASAQSTVIEDSQDGSRLKIDRWRILSDYRLVKPAPGVPDAPS